MNRLSRGILAVSFCLMMGLPVGPFAAGLAFGAAAPALAVNRPPALLPAVPLLPGNVDYVNSWGISQYPEAALSQASSEPLVPINGTWTIGLAVPTLFVGNQLSSWLSNLTFQFWDNGSFQATDDDGNRLGWSGISGLPSGAALIKTLANSSMVVQSYTVMKSPPSFSQVQVVYSVKYFRGFPVGMKMTISGDVDWPNAKGNISLTFTDSPSGREASGAYFGSSSDSKILFDWSDAEGSYPATTGASGMSVGWTVGRDFTIDPVIVVANTDVSALIGATKDNSRRMVYAVGLYWLFYTKPGYAGFYYTSSSNGTYWSTPAQFNGGSNTQDYSFWVNTTATATTAYFVTRSAVKGYFRSDSGPMYPNGTILWGTVGMTPIGNSNTIDTVNLAVGRSGNLWYFIADDDGTNYYGRVYRGGIRYSCSPSGAGIMGELIPTASGMALVWTYPGANALFATSTSDNGLTWSSVANITGYAFNATTFRASSVGDTVYVTASDGTRIYFLSYLFNSTWQGPVDIGGGSESTITVAGSNLVIGYRVNSTTVAMADSATNGTTWDSPFIVSSGENSSLTVVSPVSIPSGQYGALAWVSWVTAKTSSFYAIRAATFPVVVPNAANSPSAWSRPGLSPYESYFAHLSEYVSPGNGLLGIQQTDYVLPGRGLDLTFERVFSTPYTFSNGNPYLYETYPAVNMGLGWGLNLPWLGQDYLHLWNGQVYQYNWNGSTFENHVGESFTLVNNSGSSYDLYMVSGTDYHFDSNKSLTSMVDPTGNNSITFSYGGNGQIGVITDAVGRNVSLVYDVNGCLSTLVTLQGNWTYSYSGSRLTSVTDPLGRSTAYRYDTGINDWLLSAIVYPAGGETTYSYGNATVGTEVLTFMVTLQNVNVSSSFLSRSTAFNYNVTNGQIMFCNATISDGTKAVAFSLHDFTQSYSNQTLQNGSGSNLQGLLDFFNANNWANQAQTLDSSGNQLFNTSEMFDAWGNVVHTVDGGGHDTWYSYANTDTTNTFPNATAFSNAFFDNSGVNPNIHHLLVGEAQYQKNGTGGTVVMETYYQYDYGGHLFQQKSLHDGGWVVSAANATYDRYGNQLSSTNELNMTTYYQYSSTYSNAYLTQRSLMVNGVNVSAAYAYNFSTGAKTSETDANGHTTSYSYDALGRVTQIAYPTVFGVSASKGYSYNDTGNYVIATDENGNPTASYFDGLGRLTQVARYDGSSVYSTENYTYNWLDLQSSKTLSAGGTYTFFYDSKGRQTSMVNPDMTYTNTTFDDDHNTVNSTDEGGHLTQRGYDSMGHLNWTRQYYSTSSYYQTNYTYDLVGNLLSVTDPNGMVTYYGYDDMNRLNFTSSASLAYVPVQVSFALAGDTIFPVNVNPSTFCPYESSDLGNIRFYNDSSLTQPLVSWLQGYSGNTTAAASSATNATFWIRLYYGQVTQPVTIYMSFLNITSEFDGNYSGEAPQLSPTYAQYDNGKSVFTTFYDNFAGSSLNSTLWTDYGGLNYTVNNGFNSNGSVTYDCGGSFCNPPNALVASANSSLVDKSSTVEFYGSVWASNQTSWSWVEVGGTNSSTTDPEGTFVKSTYGSVLGIQTNSTGSSTSHTLGSSQMTGLWTIATEAGTPLTSDYYFNGGNHQRVYGTAPNIPMALGLRAPQGYTCKDIFNQTVSVVVSFALSMSWIRVIRSQVPSATVGSVAFLYRSNETMNYDGLGNLMNKTDARGYTVSYSHDTLGRLTTISYPDSTGVNFTYDPVGNMLSMANMASAVYYGYDARNRLTNQTEVVNGTSFQVLYSYDNASNVAGITYPDGQVLAYSYDTMNRAVTAGSYANLTYTLDDALSSISYANGVMTNYAYDLRDRPTRILVTYNGSAKLDLNYTYDGIGNVLSINSENYTYDYLSRIISSAGPWGITSYAYDGSGNTANYTLNGVTSFYVMGPSNELVQAGSTVLAYDAEGSMTHKVTDSTSWSYSYDFEDRLANASLDGQLVQSNVYDGSGERLMATVNGSSVVYAYEGVNILYEKNMTTGEVTDHFYLGRLQIAKLASSPYYYHFDALGSIRLVTNAGAINVFSTDYLPYGIAYDTTGTETFMYTDKPVDSSIGLYYFGARFYDPSLFRFVSRDTYGGEMDDPLTLDRYAFVRDNPLKYVDNNGHAPWDEWGSDLVSWVNGLSPDQQFWLAVEVMAGISTALLLALDAASLPFLISAAISVGSYWLTSKLLGKRLSFGNAMIAFFAGLTGQKITSVFFSFVLGTAQSAVEDLALDHEPFSFDVVVDAIAGGTASAAGAAFGNYIKVTKGEIKSAIYGAISGEALKDTVDTIRSTKVWKAIEIGLVELKYFLCPHPPVASGGMSGGGGFWWHYD